MKYRVPSRKSKRDNVKCLWSLLSLLRDAAVAIWYVVFQVTMTTMRSAAISETLLKKATVVRESATGSARLRSINPTSKHYNISSARIIPVRASSRRT